MEEEEGRVDGERFEGGGETIEGIGGGTGRGGPVEHIGFDGPEAARTPEGGDHVFDESDLDIVLGEEAAEIGLEFLAETLLGFPGHDDALGEDAVADGVLGGAEFTLGGFGPAGEAAVGAAGEDPA